MTLVTTLVTALATRSPARVCPVVRRGVQRDGQIRCPVYTDRPSLWVAQAGVWRLILFWEGVGGGGHRPPRRQPRQSRASRGRGPVNRRRGESSVILLTPPLRPY